MGPNDPFTATEPPPYEDGPLRPAEARPEAASDARRSSPVRLGRSGRPALVGLVVGGFFGVLVLTFGVGGAVLVGVLASLGALVGWLAHGVFMGRLDPSAAWHALRHTEGRRG